MMFSLRVRGGALPTCARKTETLFDQLISWENLWLAYHNAARGKRGRAPTAAFEYLLADHLLELQRELADRTYQPGRYHSIYIHELSGRGIYRWRDRRLGRALTCTA